MAPHLHARTHPALVISASLLSPTSWHRSDDLTSQTTMFELDFRRRHWKFRAQPVLPMTKDLTVELEDPDAHYERKKT